MKRLLAPVLILTTSTSIAGWDDMATAAATGYCLASHPYQTVHAGTYTPDGFETVSPPGVVGAVRRNFIFQRSTKDDDEGRDNSCKQACAEFGEFYGPWLIGVALTQKTPRGVITSGLGDIGALAQTDYSFALHQDNTAGFWSRGNTYHESGVAEADYCCCQAVAP